MDKKEVKLDDSFIELQQGHKRLALQVDILTRAQRSKDTLSAYQQAIKYMIDNYMVTIFPDVVKRMNTERGYLAEMYNFFSQLKIPEPIPNVHHHPIDLSIQSYLLNIIQCSDVKNIVEVGSGKGNWGVLMYHTFDPQYCDDPPKLKELTNEKSLLIAVTPFDPAIFHYYQGNHLVIIGDEIKSDRMKKWELDTLFITQTKFGSIRHYEQLAEVPYHLLSKRGKKLYRMKQRTEKAERRKQKQREKS